MSDLISREQALNAVEWDTEAYTAINMLPSIDAVKHGRWIEEPNCMYRCSNCGNHYPSIRGYMYYDYCPSCGARMDGDTDG